MTALGLWIAWKQSQRKFLSYEVITRESILDVPKEFRERIEVKFDSREIKQLHSIVIKFVNTGNTPIRPEDYYRYINIGFGEEAEILSFEVLKQKPYSLGVVVENTYPSTNEHRIRVEPILLNRNDSFIIRSLVSRYRHINIDGRIVGVENIREMIYLSNYSAYETVSVLLLLLGLTFIASVVIYVINSIAYIYDFFSMLFNTPLPASFFSVSIIVLVLVLMISSTSYLIHFLDSIKVHRK